MCVFNRYGSSMPSSIDTLLPTPSANYRPPLMPAFVGGVVAPNFQSKTAAPGGYSEHPKGQDSRCVPSACVTLGLSKAPALESHPGEQKATVEANTSGTPGEVPEVKGHRGHRAPPLSCEPSLEVKRVIAQPRAPFGGVFTLIRTFCEWV